MERLLFGEVNSELDYLSPFLIGVTQRTLYMLAVIAAALWFNRIASMSHVLCSALGVVVLIDPWAVLWPDFWLSFGAVAMILYATADRVSVRAARGGRAERRCPGRDHHAQAAALAGLAARRAHAAHVTLDWYR